MPLSICTAQAKGLADTRAERGPFADLGGAVQNWAQPMTMIGVRRSRHEAGEHIDDGVGEECAQRL